MYIIGIIYINDGQSIRNKLTSGCGHISRSQRWPPAYAQREYLVYKCTGGRDAMKAAVDVLCGVLGSGISAGVIYFHCGWTIWKMQGFVSGGSKREITMRPTTFAIRVQILARLLKLANE